MEIEIPKEFSQSEEMREAYLASNPPQQVAPVTPDIQPVQPAIEGDSNVPSPVAEPFNEEAYLKSLGFKSKDEILFVKEQASKLKDVGSSGIDDPVLFGLNKIRKEKPDEFDFYMKLKLTNAVDSIDLLAEDYMRKNPTKRDDPALVKAYIKRKYNLDIDIPEALHEDDATPEEIEMRKSEIKRAKQNLAFAQMQMDEDVGKVKSIYEQEFEKYSGGMPVKTPENLAEMAKPWQPVADTFTQNLKAVPILIPGSDGNPIKFMEFAIPQDQVAQIKESIVDFAVATGLPLEESSVSKIYEHVVGQVYAANLFKINHAIAEKARSMSEQEYDMAYRNPSALRDQSPQTVITKSRREEGLEKALAAEGIF